ncbi:MAG: Rab family GTPase [Pseudomonadota bacterium]
MTIRKIMLLGDVGVGKTSIANRLVFNRFGGDYKATVGSDIYQYEVIPSPIEEPFLFNVWDTDGNFGEALFRSVYIRGSNAALVVGDVKRRRSLETMIELARTFETELPGRYLCCVLNKIDLLDEGEEPSVPDALVTSGLPYKLTSAASGANIVDVFQEAAAAIVRRGQ